MTRAALLHKLERLPEMGAAELSHRLREGLRRGLDRAAFRLGPREAGDERFLARLPGGRERGEREREAGRRGPSFLGFLRRTAAPRFYLPAGEAERRALADHFARRFPERRPEIAAEAERLAAHRFELLGFGEVDAGAEIDWHRDPVTGAVWERRFWADYDLVHDAAAGDPKRVHELARHQHLPRLARAGYLLGDERWAREAVRQLLGWIDQNPPGLGVHWHSSLEIALRVVSWLWTLFFLLPSRALDEAAARRIGGSLFAQLDHVLAYPSVFTSPNTHLLGEATALYLGGVLFAGCEGARAWRDRGAELLAAEADRQVCPDGVHGELSTCYHCYALDFYLQALALARRAGDELPPRVGERAGAMLDFLLHVTRPDGTLPLLGDDDGGRALALVGTDYRRPADLLASGAALLGRGDLKAGAGAFPEASLWLLGLDGWRAWEALAADPPAALAASFHEAGYFVQRSGWGERDSHLLFDCGGLGLLGGGHGHADALSLTLWSGGRELLVDPGTFVYGGGHGGVSGGGGDGWRGFFRSSRAHNTALVDGRDQSEADGTFRWRRRAAARLLARANLGAVDYLAGEHDGYEAAAGVVHRRRLLYARPHYWLVFDDFRGRGEHDFDLLWHLAPEAEVSVLAAVGASQARVEVRCGDAGVSLYLLASAPLEVRVAEGEDDPPAGWVSRRYGERRPAPVVTARFRDGAPAAAITLLAPHGAALRRAGSGGRIPWKRPARRDHRRRVEAVPLPTRGASPALAIEVRHPGGEDVAILSPGAPELTVGPFRTRGEAFWARLVGGRPRRVVAVDSRSFLFHGVPVCGGADPFHPSGRPGAATSSPRPQAPPEITFERVDVRDCRHSQV